MNLYISFSARNCFFYNECLQFYNDVKVVAVEICFDLSGVSFQIYAFVSAIYKINQIVNAWITRVA